jgi:hypothetical protein
MTGALANLVFLATLWLIVVVGARCLEESGAKIAAALKGKEIENRPSPRIVHRARHRTGTVSARPNGKRLCAAA